MPLKEKINDISEKIRLVEHASLTYTKKDFATLNKLQNWLFEHFDEDEDEFEIQEDDPTVKAIVESQKNLFKKSMDLKNKDKVTNKQMNTMLGNRPSQMSGYNQLMIHPILILLRIMSDEQTTIFPILKSLSIDLIKFIRYHLPDPQSYDSEDKSQENDQKFAGHLVNLLEQISNSYQAVL